MRARRSALGSHRAAGRRAGDLCGLTGSYVPFARTRAEREASGDPRPSLEERYASQAEYVGRVAAAARDWQARRLLLQEDVERILDAARQRPVRPTG